MHIYSSEVNVINEAALVFLSDIKNTFSPSCKIVSMLYFSGESHDPGFTVVRGKDMVRITGKVLKTTLCKIVWVGCSAVRQRPPANGDHSQIVMKAEQITWCHFQKSM